MGAVLELDIAHSGATVLVETTSEIVLRTTEESSHRIILSGRPASDRQVVLKDVPPGTYTLTSWENERAAKRTIVVPPNTPELRIQSP